MKYRKAIWAKFASRADSDCIVLANTSEKFSYRQVHRLVCALSLQLEQLGLLPQQAVAIKLKNSLEFTCLYLACLRSGLIVVPLDPDLKDEQLEYFLDKVGATILVHQDHHSIDTTYNLKQWRLTREVLETLSYQEHSFHLGSDDDLFSITFTSGTTAKPKAIPHRAESLLANASAFNELMEHDSSQRLMHVMPMFYMAGLLNTLLCPLDVGGAIIIAPVFTAISPISFWKYVIENTVSDFWLSPTMAEALIKLDRNPNAAEYAAASINTVSIGTAPLSRRTSNAFKSKYGVTLLQSYGLSELLLVSANTAKENCDGTVGKLLKGVSVSTADDGELWVCAPYIMMHSGNSQLSFPTGDLGRLNNDGFIQIEGRKKDIIIKGGVNISPVAVEELIRALDVVEDVAALGETHEFWGEDILVFVVLKHGESLDLGEFQKLCVANIPTSMVPGRAVFVNEFPRTSTGKVQKQKLKERL